jgi:2,3-dihydroxybenzoate decarboxylase
VQREPDAAVARRRASEVNDALAREIEKWPGRYSGFAHLALQDPAAAGDELARCVRELGFCGALINGHTNGEYLDDPKFRLFWERAEEIGAPIYLHPADPPLELSRHCRMRRVEARYVGMGGGDRFACAAPALRRRF